MSKRKQTPKIRLVEIDDWCALYVDGKSVYQHHDISVSTFLNELESAGVKLNIDFDMGYADLDEEDAHDIGKLPDRIEDLKSPGFV